jgi:hypothetical protein
MAVVGVRSDWNNMLHLAGRQCCHEVVRTLRRIMVSSGCSGWVGILNNIYSWRRAGMISVESGESTI